jgi:hypothetical protein
MTAPENEPKLSLREAAFCLLVLIAVVAIMAWSIVQWM